MILDFNASSLYQNFAPTIGLGFIWTEGSGPEGGGGGGSNKHFLTLLNAGT